MMSQPSGKISYEDAEGLIETIVRMKKDKYHYPGHDTEGLAQDIRLICWDALKKFDENKLGKSVFHFIARCVDNALYNKFRGIYLDNNPPCLRCEHYIKETKSCAIDEVGCDRIIAYRDRMARRRAIAAPLSYTIDFDSEDGRDSVFDKDMAVGSSTGVCDLNESILATIDSSLVEYYKLMASGNSDEVPAHYKKQIQKHVRDMMDQ